ncbi:hypothetical protein [Aestuariirhabdus sp. LZHN29]|uniref:hypothetical protein n=1 Tax=Aestuariirhabdus sp. LZHN29 TaxID=3417462 RepID=UPI003CF8DC10
MNLKSQKLALSSIIFLLSMAFFGNAESNEPKKVIWSCKKPYGKENILWLVEWGSKSYIKVFDQRIAARYGMDGLEKRWDWGLDDTDLTYDYAITLEPDLSAQYFDFASSDNGRAKAREVYKCSK